KNKSQKAYDKKKRELEEKKTKKLYALEIKDTEEKLSEANLGLEMYKKLNQERVKLLQGQKKHYEKVQDDLLKEIDSKRKKGKPEGVAQADYEKEIKKLQENLETISKTILSLESFLLLFSVSEGDRAERVISLPVLSAEHIMANLQAMEDKLEPQLSQNLLNLATREQARLVQEQTDAKSILKRKTLKEELDNHSDKDKDEVQRFLIRISADKDKLSGYTAEEKLAEKLERNFYRTAKIIRILLGLPPTIFRKELADTALNIMDDKGDGKRKSEADEAIAQAELEKAEAEAAIAKANAKKAEAEAAAASKGAKTEAETAKIEPGAQPDEQAKGLPIKSATETLNAAEALTISGKKPPNP